MTKKDSAAKDQSPDNPCERELLEEVKRLHQSLLEQTRRLCELLAAQSPARRAPAETDYLERWEQRRREEGQRLAAELATGPARFRIGHPGDPTLVVGAADGAEAVAKYRRRLGIVNSHHEFTVAEAAECSTAGCPGADGAAAECPANGPCARSEGCLASVL